MKDLHTHTTYCDGKNTPEEMVLAAIEKGLDTIGFSGHCYTSIDNSYCMSREKTEAYKKEIADLKEKYKDKIKILCGIEQDLMGDDDPSDFDYSIGSVHYFTLGDEYIPVDSKAKYLIDAADKYFNGDIYSVLENYYSNVSKLCEKFNPTIIGHFDLVMKFNENGELFDKNNPRYVKAWKDALDKLLPYDPIFEINTGAISRGYRKTPYPDPNILDYLNKHNAKLMMTGDSHSASSLCCEFDKFSYLANCQELMSKDTSL